MARAGCVLVGLAIAVVVLDLSSKALVLAERGGAAVVGHERSLLYVAGVSLASLAWTAAIVLTRSASIAVGGGIVLGGTAGNLVSLPLWPSVDGVPNPLVVGGVTFNVADLAVGIGVVLVLVATQRFAARNRERLREPVRLRP